MSLRQRRETQDSLANSGHVVELDLTASGEHDFLRELFVVETANGPLKDQVFAVVFYFQITDVVNVTIR